MAYRPRKKVKAESDEVAKKLNNFCSLQIVIYVGVDPVDMQLKRSILFIIDHHSNTLNLILIRG